MKMKTLSSFLVLRLIPAILIPQMGFESARPPMPNGKNEMWTDQRLQQYENTSLEKSGLGLGLGLRTYLVTPRYMELRWGGESLGTVLLVRLVFVTPPFAMTEVVLLLLSSSSVVVFLCFGFVSLVILFVFLPFFSLWIKLHQLYMQCNNVNGEREKERGQTGSSNEVVYKGRGAGGWAHKREGCRVAGNHLHSLPSTSGSLSSP